jgi:hypothetical protein
MLDAAPARPPTWRELHVKLWVVNVGANTNDARNLGLRSPVFRDGTFEFVPITEGIRDVSSAPVYRSLPSWTRPGSLLPAIPASMLDVHAHLDPDFAHLTYGDAQKPRGISLRGLAVGDQLWFLARLWAFDGTRFTGASDFFFVGAFEVEANVLFEAGEGSCPPALRARLEQNSHWHRKRAGDRGTFRVIFGKPETSARFRTAVRVTPEIAGHLFAASYDAAGDRYVADASVVPNKNGKPRTWKHFCSITRTIQWYLDSDDPRHMPHLNALEQLAGAAGAQQLPRPAGSPVRRTSP